MWERRICSPLCLLYIPPLSYLFLAFHVSFDALHLEPLRCRTVGRKTNSCISSSFPPLFTCCLFIYLFIFNWCWGISELLFSDDSKLARACIRACVCEWVTRWKNHHKLEFALMQRATSDSSSKMSQQSKCLSMWMAYVNEVRQEKLGCLDAALQHLED